MDAATPAAATPAAVPSPAATPSPAGPAAAPCGPLAWGAPIVSVVVLLTFGAVVALALFREVPPRSEVMLNVLLGTLGAMATNVVGYWVGSSVGSARKDERLERLGK